MRFVEAVDYGEAPEYFVGGVARIAQPSIGTVRITFYSRHEGADGAPEYRVVSHQVWDVADWLANVVNFRAGREAIQTAITTDREHRVGVH